MSPGAAAVFVLADKVWTVSDSRATWTLQAPVLLAVAVPMSVAPSNTETALPAAAVPLMVEAVAVEETAVTGTILASWMAPLAAVAPTWPPAEAPVSVSRTVSAPSARMSAAAVTVMVFEVSPTPKVTEPAGVAV